MHILTVTAESKNHRDLSQSLAQSLQADSYVAVDAVGQEAIVQLLRTLNELRRLSQSEPSRLVFVADVDMDTELGEPHLRITLARSPLQQGIISAVNEPTISEEIRHQFDEWQTMPDENNELLEKIRLHHADSPILSGGDLDAAWDQADVGSETVGGSSPTPDQDVVELLGEAVGLTYEDDEPLRTAEKLAERDENRWELDPASQEEQSAP